MSEATKKTSAFAGWIGGYPRTDSNYPKPPVVGVEPPKPISTTLTPIAVAFCSDLRGGQITKTTTTKKA